jgi:hypothetical protein
MAPIEKLPFELLQTILLLFRPWSHKEVEFCRVLQLSGVCQSWRRVIICTPEFWSFLIIDFPQRRDRASTFDLLLQRTGTSPIDVEFNIGVTDGTNCSHLFASIAKNAPFNRWRSLVVKTKTMIRTTEFDGKDLLQCGEFQNLLNLTTCGQPPESLMRVIDHTAAALTSFDIELSSFTIDRESICYALPLFDHISRLSIPGHVFDELRELEYDLPTNITYLRSSDIPKMLRTLPYVTHLDAGLLIINLSLPIVFPALKSLHATINGTPNQQILLPKLQELVVDVHTPQTKFHSLLAPELQTLRICSSSMTYDYTMRYLMDAFCHGWYQLSPKKLSLRGVYPSVVVACLGVSRQTQDLTFIYNSGSIRFPYNWHILVHALVAKNDGMGGGWKYCPDLITLRISLSYPRPKEDCWLDYAREIGRARIGGPMKSISLDWSCGSEALVLVESAAPGRIDSA